MKLNCDKKRASEIKSAFEYFYDYITQFFINGFAELTWPKIYGRMPNCKDIPLDMWGNRNNYERNAMDFFSNGIKRYAKLIFCCYSCLDLCRKKSFSHCKSIVGYGIVQSCQFIGVISLIFICLWIVYSTSSTNKSQGGSSSTNGKMRIVSGFHILIVVVLVLGLWEGLLGD